jgi:uncharacterized membrane protein (UPF0127 family)
MAARPRLQLAGVALVLVGLALAVLAIAGLVSGDDKPSRVPTSLSDALADASEARSPFRGLTETHVAVGDRELRVVLADDPEERGQGLRERRSLGPYDGMLFVYSDPVETEFTMSTVPVPLEITFYDAAGHVVGRRHMTPCAGSDAACPLYAPDGPFVYALETLTGELPSGRLH